ncbi:hypothetical protein [Spirosoma fluviale]|uniref:Uncharacterized protein n=1 Tax=Spirosoma fluviale TaxID=1597977 RepID=A0A286FEX9_9BACT|nr:hypothetical protein [Spirosoma fluviale]SOD81805.1 hypothetical protein SAMN06269250_1919 [Spirosoma fluviale]
MQDFTHDQINDIAIAYCDMARSLNEFQVLHWPELTHEQQLDLNAYQNSLLTRAHDIQNRTTRPAFSDPSQIATRIRLATEKAQKSLQRINNLPIALNVGAITVAIASYTARANSQGIDVLLRELDDLENYHNGN